MSGSSCPSERAAAVEEWVVRAHGVESVPAVASSSSRAPFGWSVLACLDASGPDGTDGMDEDEIVRAIVFRHVAEERRVVA